MSVTQTARSPPDLLCTFSSPCWQINWRPCEFITWSSYKGETHTDLIPKQVCVCVCINRSQQKIRPHFFLVRLHINGRSFSHGSGERENAAWIRRLTDGNLWFSEWRKKNQCQTGFFFYPRGADSSLSTGSFNPLVCPTEHWKLSLLSHWLERRRGSTETFR